MPTRVQIPKDPGFFDKINYVVDAWTCPCQAPWSIYIETMGPAALKAFITLATFGWDDVLRGYWRPKDTGRKRHSRRRGKGRPGRFRGFPELGEEIGKRIPGAEELKGRKWNELGKNLWRIDQDIQRGLFWWLVADVTNDFLFDWTSQLYESEWCQQLNDPRFAADSDEIDGAFPDQWRTKGAGVIHYAQPGFFWSGGFGSTGAWAADVAGGMTIEPVDQPLQGVETRLLLQRPGWSQVIDQSPSQLNHAGNFEGVTKGTVPPGTQFLFQWRAGGGISRCEEAHFSGSACA